MTDARQHRTSRRKPAQARSKQTVAWILEGATRVFDREGLGATTHRIAQEAGVSVGTLYEYFPDKRALLLALGQQHIVSATTELDALELAWAERPPLSMATVVEELVELLVSQHRRHPSTHELLTSIAAEAPDLLEQAFALRSRIVARVQGQLKRLMPSVDDTASRSQMLVMAATELVHSSLLNEGTLDLTRHLKAMILGYLGQPT
jgi:AcrR family transcriptional regulator